MMNKRVKIGSAMLLAVAVTFGTLNLPTWVDAATRVEVSKLCSVDLAVSGDYAEDLSSVEVAVKLYKVADISESGDYTAIGDFSALDVSALEANKESNASEWLERATNAAEMIKDATTATEVAMVDGKASVTGLTTGLYLVVAQDTLTEHYNYKFTPYLISLPNNYYYTTGDDTWVYALSGNNTLGLKPEREARLGSLAVDKELTGLNVSGGNGEATFVFEARITTLEGEVSTRVVALTFSESTGWQKRTLLEDIPSGATVEVTEVYSGASYKIVGEATKTATIVADTVVSTEFVNEHDGRLNGGYGIVNNFYVEDGSYQHQVLTDNEEEAK